MNRKELLHSLGLSEEQLQDFLRKFGNFQRELDPAQLKLLVRSLPSIDQARKTFGPKPENLEELFRRESDLAGDVVLCLFAGDGGDN